MSNGKKSKVFPTDRPTDRVGHRVACTRQKKNFKQKLLSSLTSFYQNVVPKDNITYGNDGSTVLWRWWLLVACTWLYNPLCQLVVPSICRLVAFAFFGVFGRLLHHWSCPYAWVGLFHNCPCPPTCDIRNCVSGLVLFCFTWISMPIKFNEQDLF